MTYTLLRGRFVIRYPDLPRQAPEPDGDTIKFLPDAPAFVEVLPRRSGRPADINGRGVSVRLEAIDALETFRGNPPGVGRCERGPGRAAEPAGLHQRRLLPGPAEQGAISRPGQTPRACVVQRIDGNGRLIAFVYPGDHPGSDGSTVFVDDALVDLSVNAALLTGGHAYPAFYATLPASLRSHLAHVSRAARAARDPAGLWPRSAAGVIPQPVRRVGPGW